MSIAKWVGHKSEPFAGVDFTGGTVEAIKLDANRTPKLLLRLRRNGVEAEMALTLPEAEDFIDAVLDVRRWVREEATHG